MKPRCFIFLMVLGVAFFGGELIEANQEKPATFDEAVASKRDLWGEAAMRQTNGASYEFFKDLLPPPRYVNSDFRFYPIALSAPNTTTKARLISNGSGVNVRGGTRSWYDIGTPVIFRVGPDELRFGEFLQRVSHPELQQGYLPIYRIRYAHHQEVYQLEAFAATTPELADHAVVFVKFSLTSGTNGTITAEVDPKGSFHFTNGTVLDEKGTLLAKFDANWKWERQRAHARLTAKKAVTMMIPTKALPSSAALTVSPAIYDQQRQHAIKTWEDILSQSMRVETPEPIVNDAWRHLILQNFSLINGDRMHYSAGNQYDKLYEAEGSDAALAMMLWGYETDMRRLMFPLLDFTRKGLEYHQAGHKLDDVTRYYWQTRDAAFVKSLRNRWQKEVDLIINGRTNEYGLFPKEQYCGDIATPVYSLNSNAKCWRALRDFAAMLQEIGETAEAERLQAVAVEFRGKILTAVNQSIRRETEPPFVPVAMLGEETFHSPITATRIGSYWNLMANYIIGTGLFPPGSEQETWLPRYLENHGGLCMGMTRSGAANHTFWTGPHRTNPLYGLRYVTDLLRRDEPERALVSFYGMLAHGFTRNTFIGAEGCSLEPLDEDGRIFYLPPNSASNGHFLWMLRHLLAQDFDLDDDGRPETLRLAFATPRRWLEQGNQIRVEHAPTAFGPVSFSLQSNITQGEVVAEVTLPNRQQPQKTWLRVRVPEGWTVTGATAADGAIAVDNTSAADLTGRRGKQTIRFQVVRK